MIPEYILCLHSLHCVYYGEMSFVLVNELTSK